MKIVLSTVFALLPLTAALSAITSVVENGGDNEAVGTIQAKWTSVTYDTTVDNQPVAGALAGSPYTVGVFGSGAPAFVDRNHAYLDAPGGISIPTYLLGLEYIMSGNDNRDNLNYQLDVTVDEPTRVYMLIDNRLSDQQGGDPPALGAGAMQWILDEGWTALSTGNNRSANILLPDEVPIDENADGTINQYYSVYFRDVTAGTFSLLQADNDGNNMYGVVLAPLSDAGLVVLAPSPITIAEGEQSQLNWIFPESATLAEINNGIGDVLGISTDGEGSFPVSPTVTTNYRLDVETPSGNGSAETTVTVRMVNSFTVSNSIINGGESVTLSWSTRSDASVTVSGIDGVLPGGNSGIEVTPEETTTYTLTATSGAESGGAQVTVFVIPGGELFALLDIGATDGNVESGALTGAQLGGGVDLTNAVNIPATGLVSETGVNFLIAIDNTDPSGATVGNLDWRDRGTGTGDLWTYLGEDHVKNNAGIIRVTFSGLPAGDYDFLSWHFDPTFSQSEAIRILVTDADGIARDTGVTGSAFAAPTISAEANTAANMAERARRFSVRSNGGDVILYFDGTAAGDTEVPLNGLRISSAGDPHVPEIIRIDYDPENKKIILEFTSKVGRKYIMKVSDDGLMSFPGDIADSIPGQEGTTIVEETNVDLNLRPQRFYRVEEE